MGRNMNEEKSWSKVYNTLGLLLVEFHKKCELNKESSSKELYKLVFEGALIENSEYDIKGFYDSGRRELVNSKELNPYELLFLLQKETNHNRSLILYELCSRLSNNKTKIDKDICYAGFLKFPTIRSTNIDDYKFWELLGVVIRPMDSFLRRASVKGFVMDLEDLTIFFYLLNSRQFLPLTDRIQEYLMGNHKITIYIRSWENYFKLIGNKNSELFKALVIAVSDSPNLCEIEKNLIKSFIFPEQQKLNKQDFKEVVLKNKKGEKIDGFRFVGIKVLPIEKSNRIIHEKSLVVNEYYGLYGCYTPKGNNFLYDKSKDVRIYDIKDLKINVSAIVGKNGSGKSTIFELLFMALYNISYSERLIHDYVSEDEKEDLKPVNDLNVEVYIETDKLYKITVLGDRIPKKSVEKENSEWIQVVPYEYHKDDNEFKPQEAIKFDKRLLGEICYNIALNYSIHGLNERSFGDWLHFLFHKNDSYQVPIVIEPYREDGNIDVNKQEDLSKYRLLANVLKISETTKNKIKKGESTYDDDFINRVLVEEKVCEEVKVKLNSTKLQEIWLEGYDVLLDEIENNVVIMDGLIKHLELKIEIIEDIDIKNNIKRYLLKKVFKIIVTYKQYRDRFLLKEDSNFGIFDVRLCIDTIINDNSHISYKFNQAVNFIKYFELFDLYKSDIKSDESNTESNSKEFVIPLDRYAEEINTISDKNNIPLIELLPPPIFDFDITLRAKNNKVDKNDLMDFSTLSSGEKQLIYAVNSLVYHISNINSVHSNHSELVKYNNVNILLDEIELYFHPEMQRKYLSYLLDFIEKTELDNISGINICFVTHSPFILSDIPESNILFLKKNNDVNKSEILIEKPKTFGANIHDLLINGFFMENSIGEFALSKIREIVEFHKKVKYNEEDIAELSDLYKTKKDTFCYVKNNIGEDYLRGIISNYLLEIESKLQSKEEFLLQKIEEYSERLKKTGSLTKVNIEKNDKN